MGQEMRGACSGRGARSLGTGLGAWSLVLAIACAGCAKTPPEQALRQRVDELAHVIEARDARGVASLLADDFVGNDGVDRTGARRLAGALFLRYRDVGIRLGPLQVEMSGDSRARVRTTAMLTGGAGGLLPRSGQVQAIDTGWRLDRGRWVMTSARWEPR